MCKIYEFFMYILFLLTTRSIDSFRSPNMRDDDAH